MVIGSAKGTRPAVVTWAVGLLYAFASAFAALGLALTVIAPPAIFALVPAAAFALLGVFVAKASPAAQILTVIFGGLSVLGDLSLLANSSSPSVLLSFFLGLLPAIPAVLLLTPKARSYFVPPPARPFAGQAGAPVAARPPSRGAEWLKLGGGLVAVLGTLLPWTDYTFTSFNGFDSDFGVWGPLIFVLGLVIACVHTIRVNAVVITSAVLAAVLTVAALDRFVYVTDRYENFLGPGVFIVLIGALAALVGSLLALRSLSPSPTGQ
jgi:hypothetical protein